MGIDRRRFAGWGLSLAGAALTSLVPRLASARAAQDAAKPASAPDPKAMEVWWTGLEKDEPDASRALLMLADTPAETVAFLKARMKPVALDAQRFDELLQQLGADDEREWKPAFDELDYYDPRLAVDLETLMQVVVDYPQRARLVAVMSGRPPSSLEGKKVELRKVGSGGHNFFMNPGGSWWAEADISLINSRAWNNPKTKWTRAVRAISLLEHIGTPDAVAIIKDMAGGHKLAQPTRMASEALERVAAMPK